MQATVTNCHTTAYEQYNYTILVLFSLLFFSMLEDSSKLGPHEIKESKHTFLVTLRNTLTSELPTISTG